MASLSPDVITFFDIPAAEPAKMAWSPNTWKIRYALNYKQLPYKTEWVEFPDIEAVCIKHGAAASDKKPDGSPYYTLPMLYDPRTQTALADSAAIIAYLDAAYPGTPALVPAGTAALQAAVADGAWEAVGAPLFMNVAASVGDSLRPRSQAYFRATREAKFGKPLEQIGGEAYWAAMEAGLGKIAGFLGSNGPGKDELFLGDRISYADIQVASILVWARVIFGEGSAEWKRIAGWHGGRWAKLLKRFDEYATVV